MSGLTFENSANNGQSAALTLTSSSGDTVSGNIFRNNGEGVLLAAGSSNNVFTQNEVDNSATSGIEIKDGSNAKLFSDNLINGTGANSGAHAEGIYLDDNTSGVPVTNNIVTGVQSDAL